MKERPAIDAGTIALAALLLLLLIAVSGCASEGDREYSESDGWGIGAAIAEMGGDCRGAAWIDHYAETGDPGVDIIPRRPR